MNPTLDKFSSWIFRHRLPLVIAFALLTVCMGWFAAHTRVDASFNKMLPQQHEYIKNFIKYQDQFGGANRVVIALITKQGSIFTPHFFKALQEVTDEVFYLPGVDRTQVKSLFTPNVRYIEVVEDGFSGGNVIPADFEPTPEGFAKVRENIIKSGKVGQLVANDFSGAIVSAQLLEIDPGTGERLDYTRVSKYLEEKIRSKFSGKDDIDVALGVHIIGFAKVIGDISDGAQNVIFFFLISFVITSLLVWIYSRSLRLTIPTIICSSIAVLWQLGALNALGFGLDPLSILVPFLVFAIGVSHAVQMVRAFRMEVFNGLSSLAAAELAFRQILIPGGVALITDTIGFITMLVIKIPIIQELGITASLGVGVIIITNLFLLPILLSYIKLPGSYSTKADWTKAPFAPRESVAAKTATADRMWRRLLIVTKPRVSSIVILVWFAAGIYGYIKSADVRIGDLQSGVPELRQGSRYNVDSAIITERFSIGVDMISVLVEGGPDACVDYDVVSLMDRFEGVISEVPGVQSVISISSAAKVINSGFNEGSLKWRILPRNPQSLAQAISPIETSTGLLNSNGSVLPILIFLTEHKAETIQGVIAAVKKFRSENVSPKAKFILASGNIGVMAATNEVVAAAQGPILYWVFGTVITLCLITFRSIRATLCIVIPLAIVSFLAYALMAWLEIGLKTSTLPVVALGVGVGVDYGIYLFSKLQNALKRGDYFEDSLYVAYTQTGSAVVFTGLTLAIGVSTWVFSDLKLQADMGLLLGFMFLVNMLGAIILLPAMARWLYRHHTGKTSVPFPMTGNS
uniref:efflux RND transporter permease subunit n=1 Tax=Cephaloticoccus sp. TaxID=1985742 RepID=UPI00404A298C